MKLIWLIIFKVIIKNLKKKLSKEMISAIERGMKYSAKDYAEAIDFMKRSYESYKKYLRIIMVC